MTGWIVAGLLLCALAGGAACGVAVDAWINLRALRRGGRP